jgi:YVTN family beta-propeller protein
MEFRILGPLDVVGSDARIEVGAGQQRALLALLLVNANEPVSADRIIEALWRDPPPNPNKSVQIQISRLRRALGEGTIETRGRGYVLHVEKEATDAECFRHGLDEGRRQLAAGDPDGAEKTLSAALALWRGRPLDDLADEPFAEDYVRRLEELRLDLIEERNEARLARGRDVAELDELALLVEEHPFRERLRGQLMLSLYRAGRQNEALEVYRRGREVLSHELGLEPGVPLQELQGAILNHDPALERKQPREVGRTRSRRRWTAVGGGAAVVAVAALVAALLLQGGSSVAPTQASNSVGVLDPGTNRVVADIPVGGNPQDVAAGFGGVWVLNAGDETLSRIDVRTHTVHTVPLPGVPATLAVGAGAVWVVSSATPPTGTSPTTAQISRIDPVYPDLVRTLSTDLLFDPEDPVAAGAGKVFTSSTDPRAPLVELDPHSLHVVHRVPSGGALALAVERFATWAMAAGTSNLARIAPQNNTVVATVSIPAGAGEPAPSIALGDGAVWVTTATRVNCPVSISVTRCPDRPGTLYRIDPRSGTLATIRVGRDPVAVVTGHGAVWVANRGSDSVSRIDPLTDKVVRTIKLGNRPDGIAYADNAVWVTLG